MINLSSTDYVTDDAKLQIWQIDAETKKKLIDIFSIVIVRPYLHYLRIGLLIYITLKHDQH